MPTPLTVVIFLGNQDKAAELASHFDGEEYAAQVAQNSDEFYHLANSKTVNLILLDNRLPGFFSGIELVERLHADLLCPTVLLIAAADSKLNDRIRALRIATVISPAASASEVAAIARSTMMVAAIEQVPLHPKARQLVQQADFIRPLPHLAIKYAGQLNDASCPVDELATDVSIDPKMTATLLRLTNSAATGVSARVTRVFDAVTFLGIRRTVALILSASLANAQSELVTKLPASIHKWYFDRSILSAGAAAAFARRTGVEGVDAAYVLGLLQDVGTLIFAWRYPDSYPALVDRVRRVGQLKLDVAEQQEFGITHADVSAALLSKWELPQSLIKLIAHHHRTDGESQMSSTETRFLQLMRIGEAFANLADNRSAMRSQLLNQLVAQLGLTSVNEIKLCMAEAVSKAVESAKLLSIPASDALTRQIPA